MSNTPNALKGTLAALAILAAGVGYVAHDRSTEEGLQMAYVQAVARDAGTSEAVKIAMVMAFFYESSNKHIGVPYVDKLGKGQPLTVCNGLTGKGVVAGRYYTPADCFTLERVRYLGYEKEAGILLTHWRVYDPYQKAVFLDFLHNKGEGALRGSTMLRKANAGDLEGACRENTRWNRGTVNKVSVVLPGLDLRGKANDSICRAEWRPKGLT